MNERECAVCGWVYDPASGDDDGCVPPGVDFDALPSGWTCPRCGAAKERFVRKASPVDAIVDAYRKADARMRGLPVHNPTLTVEAVGRRVVGGHLVFALVTPWFLNVIVVGPTPPRHGDTLELAFSSGSFELHRGDEGCPHLALPLLSPVLDLADQAAARAVALEALRLICGPSEPEPAKTPEPRPKVVARRALFGALLGGPK